MKHARLKTWVVPATGLTLAVAGVVLLLAPEVVREAAGPASTAPRSEPRAPSPALRIPSSEPRAPNPERPTPRSEPRAPHSRSETPSSLHASDTVVALARAATLEERLLIVDGVASRLPQDQAALVLEGLLDSELPGTHYDAETLRLAVLARLGTVPGSRAERALARRLDPMEPRPMRVLALEALAARPQVDRAILLDVARGDHDSVVLEKARWALQVVDR